MAKLLEYEFSLERSNRCSHNAQIIVFALLGKCRNSKQTGS